MQLVKYFDIHDKEVTPIVYVLFFAIIERMGNDLVYKCYIESWYPDAWEDWQYKQLEVFYKAYLARGWYNCYYNTEAMKTLCENPPPIKEAMAECWKWLEAQGITKEDEFFLVKIWW